MFWVVFLKLSEGFTRLTPALATIVTIAVSFFCMSQALKVMPMGTVYAVWTGIGTIGTVLVGILVLGEPATAARLGCVGLIVAGIAGLRIIG